MTRSHAGLSPEERDAAVPAGGSTARGAARLLIAGAGTRLAYAALTSTQPGGEKTWTRTNHRGEPVTLLQGPAVIAGAVTAALTAPGLGRMERLALALAGAGAGAMGCYDDLAGTGSSKGFRGHIGALAKGEVTSGAAKLAGIGVAGLAASLVLSGRDPDQGPAGRVADVVINSGLVAGTANLVNLFDLRPGRAIKVSVLASAVLAASGRQARAAVTAPAGAAIAMLPEDLGEQAMLGDAGANAVGAMLGVAACSLPRPARVTALAAIVGLTAASEKVSFTKVIERTPALRWLDMLGRRPPHAPVPAEAGQAPAHVT
jgi:UDP-N-acetylmuramyl pentapeptide phosphotransferase/UDP-N-acetylglucosamine-1-phosphate transferase